MIIGDYNDLADGVRKMLLDQWLLKLFWSGLSTLFVFMAGRPDDAAYALMALMGADLFTGIWAASRRKDLSSKVGFRKTLTKLVGYFIAVSVGNLVGTVAPVLGFTRILAISYLAIVEGLSNIENLSAVGVKCLEPLAAKLRQTRDKLTAIETPPTNETTGTEVHTDG